MSSFELQTSSTMKSKYWVKFHTRLAFLLLFFSLTHGAPSSAHSSNASQSHSKPVLTPTSNASLFETPVNSSNAVAVSDIDSNTTARGFWEGVRDGWNRIFHPHNPEASVPAPSNEPEAADLDAGPNNDSDASNSSAGNRTEERMMRTGDSPLKVTSNDVVTTRMRLTSFIESLSASLEGMQVAMTRWFGHKKEPYTIVSQNRTMLLVEIPEKVFYAPQGKKVIKPVRSVFHKHRLTVEVEETTFTESAEGGKLSEQATGIGTEYHFDIKDAYVNVDDVYLRATSGSLPGYQIVVPLQPETEADRNGHAISRLVARATGLGEREISHWGTHREEDEHDFLRAQLGCQKKYGASGIRRMLCTCEKVHLESETRRLLCISRVADKVVRVAKENKELKIAARVYRGSIRCRNAKYGVVGSRNCLIELLERYAGEKSKLHAKYGRSILSEHGRATVDELLAKQNLQREDFFGDDEIEAKVVSTVPPVTRIFIFVAYLAGIALLLLCFFDASRQYRLSNEEPHSRGRFGRLPEQVRTLYARLVMRNE